MKEIKKQSNDSVLSYYPWEVLGVVKSTYKSTGISLEPPPTIDIHDTVTLTARGNQEWWSKGNDIGLPACMK